MVMADPKWESYRFIEANDGLATHFYATIADAECGSCMLKESGHGHCVLPEPKTLDVLIGCAPCQPYSKLSRSTACPTTHKLYHTMHGDNGSLISFTKQTLPIVVISENVTGTLQCRNNGQYRDSPPSDHIVQRFMAIKDENDDNWFVDFVVLKTCASSFVKQKRPRLCLRFGCCVMSLLNDWMVVSKLNI